MDFYEEPGKKLPVHNFDVVVLGGGTAGVLAALAAARQGANTALVEAKGYTGGTAVEGGTALHSYFNLWKAFEDTEKKQVVQGISEEIVQRLQEIGGTTGHAEMLAGSDYDSVCTAIDTELYKLVTMEMLAEDGVHMYLNTWLCDAVVDGGSVRGAVVESRSGREVLAGSVFVDCTGYGDFAAHAGAPFTEPNDHPVANSMGVGGVVVENYWEFIRARGVVKDLSRGLRSGHPDRIVRVDAQLPSLPEDFRQGAAAIGMQTAVTTVHDDYFMFVKLNYKMDVSPTDRDAVAAAELELRRRQYKAIQLLREHIPGCEHAFIARTSPSLCIRRARCIACEYDLTNDDVVSGRRFDDEVLLFGFHDQAPRFQIRQGGVYGVPYRALQVRGLDNVLAAGMLITSEHEAHMSTRNTVCCMGQGEAAGTAAALAAQGGVSIRQLPYARLRQALLEQRVCLDYDG